VPVHNGRNPIDSLNEGFIRQDEFIGASDMTTTREGFPDLAGTSDETPPN
jgi:hypothetical protein